MRKLSVGGAALVVYVSDGGTSPYVRQGKNHLQFDVRTFAALLEISMVISFPCSSNLGFCRTVVAHVGVAVVKGRA